MFMLFLNISSRSFSVSRDIPLVWISYISYFVNPHSPTSLFHQQEHLQQAFLSRFSHAQPGFRTATTVPSQPQLHTMHTTPLKTRRSHLKHRTGKWEAKVR
jgi:hypothetical protein